MLLELFEHAKRPLIASWVLNDIVMIAEGMQGAATGSEDVQVTHMLFADDLTLLVSAPDAMQLC